jgi:hypothetical protein
MKIILILSLSLFFSCYLSAQVQFLGLTPSEIRATFPVGTYEKSDYSQGDFTIFFAPKNNNNFYTAFDSYGKCYISIIIFKYPEDRHAFLAPLNQHFHITGVNEWTMKNIYVKLDYEDGQYTLYHELIK